MGSEQYTSSKSTQIFLFTILASVLLVGAVIFVATGSKEGEEHVESKGFRQLKKTSNVLKDACSSTLHPELCVSSISTHGELSSKADHMEIVQTAVRVGISAVEKIKAHVPKLSRPGLNFRQRGALKDCMEMFEDTLDELHDTLSDLQNATFLSMPKHADDLKTLLSGAITNQYTCLDGFHLCKGHLRQDLSAELLKISHLVSNSLAMVCNISGKANQILGNTDSLSNSRFSDDFVSSDDDGFPSWMSAGDRRLLQTPAQNIKVNVVVAKDGSGRYTTILAALAAAPQKSTSRYVIHIKKGVYQENVDIPQNKHNIMFIGDGKDVTVVSGNRNVKDGFTTFNSATVAVNGKGFIAREITFKNTAGAAKHQAVALRVGSDLSVFWKCSFEGFQDTLYVHSLRQFYRECDIYGTVDFIFGNAAVVLQNCNIMARKPDANQKIMYTAQGREDPNQNTGIVIQNCRLSATSDLVAAKSSFQVYLGRPWKTYSRTVIMQSHLEDLIHPAGWHEWEGNFALSSLYYAEYMNRGPGSGTANRVKWGGYRVIKSSSEASQFTVNQFLQGNSWLPSTGIQYTAGFTG